MDEVLREYEARPGGFEVIDVAGELFAILKQRRGGSEAVPVALQAEVFAFDLNPSHPANSFAWKTYYGPQQSCGGVEYPALADITAEVIDYWAVRARAAVHPTLCHRYADVAWDFWRPVRQSRCPHDLPRIMIDAAIEIARRELDPHRVLAVEQLRRALQAAIQYKYRVEAVRDATLAYEDAVASDNSPGLWGFSFDLLSGNKKACLTADQETRVISDLEARLVRLADATNEDLNPHNVQFAALRLADYYRRAGCPAETRRVLGVYTEAFLRKSAAGSKIVACGWLKDVHDNLVSFDLHDDAKVVLTRYADAGRRVGREMPRHEVSVEIDVNDSNALLDFLTEGTWEVVFAKVVHHYLIGHDETSKNLAATRAKSSILNLFSTNLVDRDGRTVSKVGPLDDDLEGNIVRHAADGIKFSGTFLRATMERLVDTRAMDWPAIEGQLRPSPVFAERDWPTLERGVRAYLEGDWLVAVHLLVPRVEAAVRRLVETHGGQILKPGRHDALHLRNLDELLRDGATEAVLTPDVTFYLRTLFTDQRGWNLRNDVAHGMEPMPGFTAAAADRVFHAVLILGELRRRDARPASATGGI